MTMRPLRHLARTLGSFALLSAALSSEPSLASAHPTGVERCGTWRVVPSPNVGTGDNSLAAIDAIAADDIWAVGSPGLTLHWDGFAWSVVPFPTMDALGGVAAIASDDVWAVGGNMTAHWDGVAWTVVPNPDAGPLVDITGVTSDEVWAAGWTTINGRQSTLAMHWDGAAWEVVPSPNGGFIFTYLEAISAASADDVWAVGSYFSTWAYSVRTFGMHWDGSRWSAVPMPNGWPNVPFNAGRLYGVAAVSADEAWAVGTHYYGYASQNAITVHWDGLRWRSVRHQEVDTDGDLFGVDGIPGHLAWAVGDSFNKYNGDGSTNDLIYQAQPYWFAADPPAEEQDVDQLLDVAAVGPNDVWAVGWDADPLWVGAHTLVEHCSP